MSATPRRALRIDDPIGAAPDRHDESAIAGMSDGGPGGYRLRELALAGRVDP